MNVVSHHYTREFVGTAGYAMVQVDVRGTGASGGVYSTLWSDDEQCDSKEILDWIVAQASFHTIARYTFFLFERNFSLVHRRRFNPNRNLIRKPWSDGRVSLWGISYDANVAALTVASGHEAVKACVPMFYFWDLYKGLIFPGGVMLRWFAMAWQGDSTPPNSQFALEA